MSNKNVIPFARKEKVVERVVTTAIPVCALVDPKDARNCLSASWENRHDVPGRCPGMGTVLDTGDLVCEYFVRANPIAFAPLDISQSAILRATDGSIAQWGTSGAVRRCDACIVGEQLMKRNTRKV